MAEKDQAVIDQGSEELKPALTEEELLKIKKDVVKQIEYYLGDYNYPRDKFFQEEAKKDDGWILLSTMTKCKRLAEITTDEEIILDALEGSKVVEVDSIGRKVRRIPTLSLKEVDTAEEMARTLYLKNFPKDGSVTHDKLIEFFEGYGAIDSVQKRNFLDKRTKKSGFKGSVFVVFKTKEDAEKLYNLSEIRWTNIPLLRRWKLDYDKEKAMEREERASLKEMKEAKRKRELELVENIENVAKNSFLHLSNIPEDANREQVKSAFSDLCDELAFFGYRKGDKEGYARVTEGMNKVAFEKLDGKLKIGDTLLTVRLVEGEEEETQRKKALEAKKATFSPNYGQKRKRRNGQQNNFRSKKSRVQ